MMIHQNNHVKIKFWAQYPYEPKGVDIVPFEPKRVMFEPEALNYPLGRKLFDEFKSKQVEISMLKSHNRVTGIPGATAAQAFGEGKNTLVVGLRRTLKYETCKPSAHYQLPLVTGCSGMCTYCYLNTQLGKKPYVRVYVNVDEVLEQCAKYIGERQPEITFFEGAATSDPIPVEPYTGSLRKTIEFFGQQELGRFRFVTKFTDVDGLLDAKHNGHTMIRFSINADSVIRKYEHKTPSLADRIGAAHKIIDSGYPIGFIIAPVMLFDNWKQEYEQMLLELDKQLAAQSSKEIHFEIISHRFTAKAKQNINQVFPDNDLPMDEEQRKFKYGQFGYGKYVYEKEQLADMGDFFKNRLVEIFPKSAIDYII
jgi:spore photoproduct lyase